MTETSASASPLFVRLDASPQTSVQLKRALTIVGSKRHSHLRIISSTISGTQAVLLNLGNNVFLRDLTARSQVKVNEREVRDCRLKLGDIVTFGEMRFRFVDANVLRESLTRIRPGPAELRCESDGHCLTLDKPITVIGRHEGADIVIGGSEMSRAHTVIYEQEGCRFIRDLSSRSGTFVNEQSVRSERLRDGDFIRVGTTTFRLVLPEGEVDSDLVIGEPAEADFGEQETQTHDHVFVSDPVIISSPTESVDLDEIAQTEASELAEPASMPASPSGWHLDENPGTLIELAMSASEAPEPFVGSLQPARADDENGPGTPGLLVPLEMGDAISSQEMAAGNVLKDTTSVIGDKSEPLQVNAASDSLELVDLTTFTERTPSIGRKPSADTESRRDARSQKTRDAQRARNTPKKSVEELLASEVLTLFPDETQRAEQAFPDNGPTPQRRAKPMILIFCIAFGVIAAATAAYWHFIHHHP